jgi:hypothetical protein
MAFAIVTGPAPAQGTDVSVTWETCAEGTTIVSEKEVCYVYDVARRDKAVVFKICAGVNLSGGNLIFGGSAKTVLCATVKVPVGSSMRATRDAAEQALRKELLRHCGKVDRFWDRLRCAATIGRFKLKDSPPPRDLQDAVRN